MRISTSEAAEKLNMSKQTLRLWIRSGSCPFGQAFKGSGKMFVYYINRMALIDYLSSMNGKEVRK